MWSLEKILNEITLILTIVTMSCVVLLKYGKVNKGLVIFLCILTLLVYLCSRAVNNNNSKLSKEDKMKLENLNERLNKKKGKKKDGKKDSSNSR